VTVVCRARAQVSDLGGGRVIYRVNRSQGIEHPRERNRGIAAARMALRLPLPIATSRDKRLFPADHDHEVTFLGWALVAMVAMNDDVLEPCALDQQLKLVLEVEIEMQRVVLGRD
jgi:hypothetical protein